MEDQELDFEDISLGETSAVDTGIEEPEKKETQEPIEPEKKQRGRPKKDAKSEGTEVDDKAKGTDKPIVEEPTEPEEGTEDTPLEKTEESFIKSIASKLGIELKEGEEYEETEEGLIELTQRAAEEFADTKLNGWLESLPPVASDFFDYLQMLGEEANEDNIKSFFTAVNPEIDYKSVDMENVDAQKAVMRTFFKKNGFSDDEIKESIDDMEVAGTLIKQAKMAASKLATMQEKQRQELLTEQKEKDRVKKENNQKFFNNVKQVIETGKVNNFTIPVTEKKAIFDYDTQGDFMKDLNEILKDPSKRVELAIAVKNKFNLNKYISNAAQTQKANTLRDKLKAGTNKMKNGATNGAVANDSIDWDDV